MKLALCGWMLATVAVSLPGLAAELESVPPPTPEMVSAGHTVTVRDEAYVKGPQIHLGDVADIRGERAPMLASIEVAGAASPGASKRLNSAYLVARVKNAGFEADGIRFGGADAVLARTLSLEVSRETIADELRKHIEANIPWNPADTMIAVTPPTQAFVVPEGDLEILWWPNPQYRWLGTGTFRGEIRVDGCVKQSFTCRANVEAYADVLVADTDLPRGTRLSIADIRVQKKALSQLRYGFVSDPDNAVGLLARKTLFPGDIITKRDLVLPRLIKRFQTVTVEARAGAMLVQGRARALKDGSAGDIIECKNEKSKEQFYGRVREDGVVVVE